MTPSSGSASSLACCVYSLPLALTLVLRVEGELGPRCGLHESGSPDIDLHHHTPAGQLPHPVGHALHLAQLSGQSIQRRLGQPADGADTQPPQLLAGGWPYVEQVFHRQGMD